MWPLTSASNPANDDRGTSHTISQCISLPRRERGREGEEGEEGEEREVERKRVCVCVQAGRVSKMQLIFVG